MIVTDAGFVADDWTGGFAGPEAWAGAAAIDLPAEAGLSEILQVRDNAPRLVRITFGSFADGRGFTLARRLRAAGYSGRLRAAGKVIADQYAMARRSGFDEVEIDGDIAARQPEDQWLARSDWKAHDYQARLGRRVGGAAAG